MPETVQAPFDPDRQELIRFHRAVRSARFGNEQVGADLAPVLEQVCDLADALVSSVPKCADRDRAMAALREAAVWTGEAARRFCGPDAEHVPWEEGHFLAVGPAD